MKGPQTSQSAKIICQIRPKPLASPLPGSVLDSQTGQQCISTDSSIANIHIIRAVISLAICGGFLLFPIHDNLEKALFKEDIFNRAQHETQQRWGYSISVQQTTSPRTPSSEMFCYQHRTCCLGGFCEAYPYFM